MLGEQDGPRHSSGVCSLATIEHLEDPPPGHLPLDIMVDTGLLDTIPRYCR